MYMIMSASDFVFNELTLIMSGTICHVHDGDGATLGTDMRC